MQHSGKIEDSALMHYVIKGINYRQESKTILYGCKNLTEFKEKLKIYGIMKNDYVKCKVPGKKYGLEEKDEQRIEAVSRVGRAPAELQHPSDLPKLEDGLKHLETPDPMIQCITEEPGEYIVAGTKELQLEICLKDLEENYACISLKKTDPVVVVPESMQKEVKRPSPPHDKRRPRIKENKDYYFITKLRQKIENSVANCDHRTLLNHKRRKTGGIFNPLQKEDVPLKTYHTDHLGPHKITNFKGVMEQTVQFEQDLQHVVRRTSRFQDGRVVPTAISKPPPLNILRMSRNVLSVLGACQLIHALRR
ncbi:elongation factor 2 [Trichonephila clavipes]|nr:elongation factor 2 [Trichonephila clavipes]